MARIVVHLPDPEMNALHQLAQQEYRPLKAQAAVIIRNELKRLGLVSDMPAPSEKGTGAHPDLEMRGAA